MRPVTHSSTSVDQQNVAKCIMKCRKLKCVILLVEWEWRRVQLFFQKVATCRTTMLFFLKCCILFSRIQQAALSTIECSLLSNKTNNWLMLSCVSHLQYIWNGKGTGVKMCPAIICGIITGDTPINCWPIFLSLPSNSPWSQFKKWIVPSTG